MFSNSQHETPKKTHIAPLRIGRKTQATRPCPAACVPRRAHAHTRTESQVLSGWFFDVEASGGQTDAHRLANA